MTRPISPTDSSAPVNPQHLLAVFDPDADNPTSQTVSDVVAAGAEIMRGDGETQDVAVFWSPTAQHGDADGIRFGELVTIAYGGSSTTSTAYNVSRIGHIVTMVIAPLGDTIWAAIEAETNVTVSNADGDQFGAWVTASREAAREDVASTGQWFRAISAISPGTEVWRELDLLDAEDDTHLTVGARTGTTLELRSSTGDDVLIPSATPTEAGLESAADAELLAALPPKWTVGTYSVGTERSWAQRLYHCIADRTVSDTDNPAADTTGWAQGASSAHAGTTNLGIDNRTASSLDIVSDTGSDATVPSASQTEAGLESAADKTKLDGIAAGAQVNVQANWNQGQSTAGDYIRNKPTIPDTSSFRTQAQITAEIAAAISGDGKVIDGGEWDATTGYAERTLVFTTGAGAATYLSRVAVVANTAATSEPGVGTAWETSWLRVGYQDGPPNAFIDAAFTGRHLTLSREGGTNPQTLEVPIGTGQFVLERIGRADFDVTTNHQYAAESSGETPIDVSDIEDDDILAVQVIDQSESADFHWFTGADMHRNVAAGDTSSGRAVYTLVAAGIALRLGIDSDGHLLVSVTSASTQDPMPLTLYRAAGNTAPAGSTRVERITFQTEAAGTTDFEAQPIATDPVSVRFGDGSPQIVTNVGGNDFDVAAGVHHFHADVRMNDAAPRNAQIHFEVRNAADDSVIAIFDSTEATNDNPVHVTANGVLYLSQATTVNIFVDRVDPGSPGFGLPDEWYVEFTRWGGGVTGFNPGRIGTATFDLTGSAQNIALTDDTTSAAIVAPAEGWVIAVVTVPGLGLNGSVIWMLAEDLRAADADNALSASLYTNSANQVFFGAGDQDGGATMGNRIILHHTGTITESSGGAQPIINPSILEFDVTGDATVTDADLTRKRYSYVSRISQSAHVGSARIVGFLGTAANPSNVDELATLSNYFRDEGSFLLPARMLAAVRDIYTIREEVYPIGTPDTTAPTIYHDFRIQRVAPTGQLHFGYVRGGADYAAAALLVDFANDIGDPRDATAGDYTVSGIPADTQLYRLFWAVPDTFTQPTGWTVAGFPITNSLDTTGQSRTIGGVDYTIYVTDSSYDSTSNGDTTIAVTTG